MDFENLFGDIHSFDINKAIQFKKEFSESCSDKAELADFLFQFTYAACDLASIYGNMGTKYFAMTTEAFSDALSLMEKDATFFFRTREKALDILDMVANCPNDFSARIEELFERWY